MRPSTTTKPTSSRAPLGCDSGHGDDAEPAFFSSAGKCFRVVANSRTRNTWFDANWTCTQHGGRLSTVKYLSDLLKFKEHDLPSKTMKVFNYIGILAAKLTHNLPSLYMQSWVWLDGRVVHSIYRERYVRFNEMTLDFSLHNDDPRSPYPDLAFTVNSGLYGSRTPMALCEITEKDHPADGEEVEEEEEKSRAVSTSSPSSSSSSSQQPRREIQIHKIVDDDDENNDDDDTLRLLSGDSGKRFTRCPARHFTHDFLACDDRSSCWADPKDVQRRISRCDYHSGLSAVAPSRPLPPSFPCTNQIGRVPYSLVCDHRKDCQDGSDEIFCRYVSCQQDKEFQCNNHQCAPQEAKCDRAIHCMDWSDEELCEDGRNPGFGMDFMLVRSFGPRILVTMSPSGFLNTTTVTPDFACPHTHFLCPDDSFCLPVYLRCNGVADCPGREDEAGCEAYTCPGYYRCRASAACVPASHLCDGLHQCPQWDDELLCGFTCPQRCTCYGHAFFCADPFPAGGFPRLRFLDGRDSGLTTADLVNNVLLVDVSLVRCGLRHLTAVNLPNLLFLDLRQNLIEQINVEDMKGLLSLRVLNLGSNPITLRFIISEGNETLGSVTKLDLSDTRRKVFSTDTLVHFPALASLNLSRSGVERMEGEGFQTLSQLLELDLRGCPMVHFPRDLLQGLESLQDVYADNYKLCCPATLPESFNAARCRAPEDEISSCEALLRTPVYRVFLSLFAGFTLLGNMLSFIFRTAINRKTNRTSFGVFVTHLCVSDFLMGVYLAIIGVADQAYVGTYLWNDVAWTHSAGCSVAGFLSMLSSEVSVSFVGLITLDRFIVIRFPFTTRRFRPLSAQAACAAVWLAGLLLAAVPLLPATSHWHFYSQTGICIPLPISRKTFPGQDYSFAVMIVLNFVLFLMIGSGQGLIYKSITGSRLTSVAAAADTTKASKDVTVARRLLTVVMSDFMCWFPIGLVGLLAASDVPVPGELNVAFAIFVLPFNSALNPFLYTINMLLENSRQRREQELRHRLLAELNEAAPEVD